MSDIILRRRTPAPWHSYVHRKQETKAFFFFVVKTLKMFTPEETDGEAMKKKISVTSELRNDKSRRKLEYIIYICYGCYWGGRRGGILKMKPRKQGQKKRGTVWECTRDKEGLEITCFDWWDTIRAIWASASGRKQRSCFKFLSQGIYFGVREKNTTRKPKGAKKVREERGYLEKGLIYFHNMYVRVFLPAAKLCRKISRDKGGGGNIGCNVDR